MTHNPAFTGVSVVPLTVQNSLVVLAKATGRPLVALATSAYEGVAAETDVTGVKVTVCGVKLKRVTVNL